MAVKFLLYCLFRFILQTSPMLLLGELFCNFALVPEERFQPRNGVGSDLNKVCTQFALLALLSSNHYVRSRRRAIDLLPTLIVSFANHNIHHSDFQSADFSDFTGVSSEPWILSRGFCDPSQGSRVFLCIYLVPTDRNVSL